MPAILTIVAFVSISTLVCGASAVLTFATRRSVLVSTLIALAMTLAFVEFVAVVSAVMGVHDR